MILEIADSLDYISRVDAYYQNAFDTMLLTVSLLFGGAMIVVGFVIPVIINYFQRKNYQSLIKDTSDKLDTKIEDAKTTLRESSENAIEELNNKIIEAELNFERKINHKTNELNKKITTETGELSHVISKVEKDFNEKRQVLFEEVNSLIKNHKEATIKDIDTKVKKSRDDLYKDLNERIRTCEAGINVLNAYLKFLKAKKLYDESEYFKSFKLSIDATADLVVCRNELAEQSSKFALDTFPKIGNVGLLDYWSKTLDSRTDAIMKKTNEKKIFPSTKDNVSKIRSQIINNLQNN